MDFRLKRKIDIAILIVLMTVIGARIFYVNSDKNIEHVELSSASLSCEQNRKYGQFTGYFTVEGLRLSSPKGYESCESFKNIMMSKSISGNFIKTTNRLVDITINDKPYYERSNVRNFYYSIFGSLFIWVFLRTVIFWVVRKYA